MSPDEAPPAHISPQTTLIPAINAWRFYLEDQGRSPNTIKAFIGDLNLLASYLPPDRTIGSITTTDLNNFPQLDAKRPRCSLQPQDPLPEDHLPEGLLPLAARVWRAAG